MLPETDISGRPKLRLRFSLLALLIFVTLVCGLLAWLVQPKKVVAESLFRVSSRTPSLLGDDGVQRGDASEFEIIKNTQVAFVKSHFVLNAAARKLGIAKLSILRGQEEALEEWLEERLEVEFPQGGEIMQISLRGNEEHASDLTQIVDAVATAYADEVIYKERARHSTTRDILARSLDELNDKINERWTTMLAIVKDSGRHEGAAAEAFQQLYLDELKHIDLECLRLESEQLKLEGDGENGDAKFYETRIAQLRERQAGLVKQLDRSTEPSVELDAMKAEIAQLQQTANELAIKRQKLRVEANAPMPIELIQKAVVSPAD